LENASLTRDAVLRRLEVLAAAKTGDPIPDFLPTNDWGKPLSALAARAAELIFKREGLLPDPEVDRRLDEALRSARLRALDISLLRRRVQP
jgi:hypothetical protein